MAILCDFCRETESKYKCPTCGLRYCSISCYKPHKLQHEESKAQIASITTQDQEQDQPKIDRPGTTQRAVKQSFAGFEQDAEFQRLVKRYPKLQIQLQGIFALTMDPGPDEDKSWNRQQLPLLERSYNNQRGTRGRASVATRGRGGMQRGGRSVPYEPPEGRQRGRWSKEKGDLEALYVMRKMQDDASSEEMSEGLREFVELVKMRYGHHNGA